MNIKKEVRVLERNAGRISDRASGRCKIIYKICVDFLLGIRFRRETKFFVFETGTIKL